ncbi:MAG: hypothetical protein EZS28_037593 [Streblomastix strix]|uniref:Uncharacterized protein n=1 Tax=Streblomastix strix TaxID=222440 RepID=A0A5J4UAF9_9EUKA|nr:MAG: hypothetical protein EZS28_037593 [Streblomastix strix]
MDKENDIEQNQEDYERWKQLALRLDVHERKRILFKVGYSDTLLDKKDKEYGHKVEVLIDNCGNYEINEKNKDKDKYQIEETISQPIEFQQQSALPTTFEDEKLRKKENDDNANAGAVVTSILKDTIGTPKKNFKPTAMFSDEGVVAEYAKYIFNYPEIWNTAKPLPQSIAERGFEYADLTKSSKSTEKSSYQILYYYARIVSPLQAIKQNINNTTITASFAQRTTKEYNVAPKFKGIASGKMTSSLIMSSELDVAIRREKGENDRMNQFPIYVELGARTNEQLQQQDLGSINGLFKRMEENKCRINSNKGYSNLLETWKKYETFRIGEMPNTIGIN